MSYEGHFQLWCDEGHYWESGFDYEFASFYHEDTFCPDCGKQFIFINQVDDTNCESDGEIEVKYLFKDKKGKEVYEIPKIIIVAQFIHNKLPVFYYNTKDGIYCSHPHWYIYAGEQVPQTIPGVRILPIYYSHHLGYKLDMKL